MALARISEMLALRESGCLTQPSMATRTPWASTSVGLILECGCVFVEELRFIKEERQLRFLLEDDVLTQNLKARISCEPVTFRRESKFRQQEAIHPSDTLSTTSGVV